MDESEGFTGVVERAYNNESINNYFSQVHVLQLQDDRYNDNQLHNSSF
jgi:hypothetical protein